RRGARVAPCISEARTRGKLRQKGCVSLAHRLAYLLGSARQILQDEIASASRMIFSANAYYSAAARLWPSRRLSLRTSSSAASAITVPGGKIASAPALRTAS